MDPTQDTGVPSKTPLPVPGLKADTAQLKASGRGCLGPSCIQARSKGKLQGVLSHRSQHRPRGNGATHCWTWWLQLEPV